MGLGGTRAATSQTSMGRNYNRGDLPHETAYFAKGIIWKNEGKVAEQDYYFSWPKVSDDDEEGLLTCNFFVCFNTRYIIIE